MEPNLWSWKQNGPALRRTGVWTGPLQISGIPRVHRAGIPCGYGDDPQAPDGKDWHVHASDRARHQGLRDVEGRLRPGPGQPGCVRCCSPTASAGRWTIRTTWWLNLILRAGNRPRRCWPAFSSRCGIPRPWLPPCRGRRGRGSWNLPAKGHPAGRQLSVRAPLGPLRPFAAYDSILGTPQSVRRWVPCSLTRSSASSIKR